MVEFGGWELPVQFTSILDETRAVRSDAGLFDVSHMGRLDVRGDEQLPILQALLSRDLEKLDDSQAAYCMLCNERGGVIDDLIAVRFSEDHFMLVVNASRLEADIDWMSQHDLVFEDVTADTVMIAIQGPKAIDLISSCLGTMNNMDPHSLSSTIRRFGVNRIEQFVVLGTGYTGELGVEIICPAKDGPALWLALVREGIVPCGLGARDILRLEAGLCLYGHELNEDVTPVEADLMGFVDLEKPHFTGKMAIEIKYAENLPWKRRGLILSTRSAAREQAKVFAGGKEIGWVSSGAFSPMLNKAIAMAYLSTSQCAIGDIVDVDIRGKHHGAKVVSLPFLQFRSG